MSGGKPWEKYQAAAQAEVTAPPPAAAAAKPWERYQAAAEPAPSAAVEIPPSATAPASAADAGLQGFGQGGTLGYQPELQAAAAYGLQNVLPESMGGGGDESFADLKRYFAKRNENLKAAQPGATSAGNIAGAVMTLPVGGPEAEGAGLLTRMLNAGKAAGAYGAASNPTTSEETDYVNPLARLKSGLESAVVGGLMGGLIKNTGPAASKSGQKMSDKAVVKQIGANAGQIKKILQKNEIPKLGEFLGEQGLMRPGNSIDDVVEKTGEILKEDGPKIGKLYADAQAAAEAQGSILKNKINGNKLADKIVADAKAAVRTHADRNHVNKTIEDAVAPLRDMGDDANIVDLHDFRKSLDEGINWGTRAKERDAVQRALIDARNSVADETKRAIDSLDKVLGGKKLDELKALNARYSTASTVNNISTQGASREMAKAFMGHGVIGAGAGVGGASIEYRRSHDPLKALGAGIATALGVTAARKFGNPIGFYGGKGLNAIGEGLSNVTPPAESLGLGVTAPWLLMGDKR